MQCVIGHAVRFAGAGVGKGRTIAGLVLENWRCGRKRHLWLTVGSDLKVDSRSGIQDPTLKLAASHFAVLMHKSNAAWRLLCAWYDGEHIDDKELEARVY